jgi:hypothetical protein
VPSNENLSEKTIGKIIYPDLIKNNHQETMDKIKNANFATVDMHALVYDICVLPNNCFLSLNFDSISVVDEKFNIIKTIQKIDDKPISSPGSALNMEKNCIYVSNRSGHCVYMLDIDLNMIKSFGSEGKDKNSFKYPHGICFNDDYLYVCDYSNFRIQIFNSDLEYGDSIKLSVAPLTIQISGTSIGIVGHDNSVHFYDKSTKALKKQHNQNCYGRISEINSLFYVITKSSFKMLYCFDADGNLLSEESINRLDELLTENFDRRIFYYKNNVFMTNGIEIIKFI